MQDGGVETRNAALRVILREHNRKGRRKDGHC